MILFAQKKYYKLMHMKFLLRSKYVTDSLKGTKVKLFI